MKKLLGVLCLAFISGCSGTVGDRTTVITDETLEKRKNELKNSTISNAEFAWANLQGIPVMAEGVSKDTIKRALRKSRVRIVDENESTIKVRGKKKRDVGEVTLQLDKVDYFIYTFEAGNLIAGPNILNK